MRSPFSLKNLLYYTAVYLFLEVTFYIIFIKREAKRDIVFKPSNNSLRLRTCIPILPRSKRCNALYQGAM